MRILFTTAWYPNRKVAGDGIFIQKHARAVARLNDVAVLMVQTDEAKTDHRIEVCPTRVDDHLTEVLVYVPKTWREIPLLTGLVRMFWLMAGYIRGYRYIQRHYWQGQRPDVCHVNVLTRAAGLPWLLKRLYHIPYIITEHWSRYARPEAYPSSSLQLRLGRMFVRDASYVCPVSINLEQAMKKWQLDNRHYTRVSNVVDTDIFTPHSPLHFTPSSLHSTPSSLHSTPSSLHSTPSTLHITPSTLPSVVRFVHVSWMRDDSKNISGILRVLARVKAQRQDFHLRLIGEGNDKEQLMALAESLGLTPDYVTFVEACRGQALADELLASDALLMFSNFENQPVSVLEALACGLPVIATSVGSIPSMLARNRGITVTPGDEDGLYEVLLGFIGMYASMTPAQRADRTLALQRHEYVASQHSPEVIARQFDALYRASRAATC